MTVELILIRHGETVHNRERRVQGHKDSPLTLIGIEQARRVGVRLRDAFNPKPESFRFLASPIGRAWQTAVIVLETIGVPPAHLEHQDLLKEMTWGDWDGLTGDEIAARDPDLWQARIDDKWTVAPPGGGETQQDIVDRGGVFLASLAPETRAVVIAHGAIGRAIRCAYAGLAPAAMLEMDEPHEALFHLKDGQVSKIDAGS